MTSLSAFELVSQNLLSIGAISINDFLSSGYAHELVQKHDVFHQGLSSLSGSSDASTSTPALPPAAGSSKPKSLAPPTKLDSAAAQVSQPPVAVDPVAQLQSTCSHQFGPSNRVLKFEFLEESVDRKQCILTIGRPDGSARSYKTEPVFRRRVDAQAQAAAIAIEHDAINFIIRGDSDELKAKKGVLLAPLDDTQPIASTSKLSSNPSSFLSSNSSSSFLVAPELTARVQEIDACCREWRGDQVKPCWLDFNDTAASASSNCGAVLKIQLAPHCYRVYSCQPAFDTPAEAREYCAGVAIKEGVMEFIKHGNGQTTPQSDLASSSSGTQPESTAPRKQDLQSFYESLPRPFDEAFGDRLAYEINAPVWLGKILTKAKGARFSAEFYRLVSTFDGRPIADWIHPQSTDLQGSVLRLKRPGECRTYLMEPRFPTYKNAKAAVSFLALSQGAGKWIREVSADLEALVTPEMRRFALKSLFPTLAQEMQRLTGSGPRFDCYTTDDAFGCKLSVDVKPKGQGDAASVRCYEVPATYGSKSDAKIAVAYLAAQQGVIDFLRRGGEPLPPGQPPAFSCLDGQPRLAPNTTASVESRSNKKKRKKKEKEGAGDEGPPAKKQKTANVLPKKPGGGAGAASLPKKPDQGWSQRSTSIFVHSS
ncbi:hypothetical protein DFH08DRAFT_879250 [Mycena albidolilacea]|uniref:Uncharacterized protein n=1 Tax=Mycena albidolilacea TaxID=1033008 RepID=A0AAD7EMC9_9AGAR|nr:hypothetical protein DFH08DRAFT_879250 [Mycena albidolilacea]